MGTRVGDIPRCPSVSLTRVGEDDFKQNVEKGFEGNVWLETLSMVWNLKYYRTGYSDLGMIGLNSDTYRNWYRDW